jgi:hypothetical protein
MLALMRRRILISLGGVLIALAVIAFAAWAVNSSEPEPTLLEDRIDLSSYPESIRSLSVQASTGDRIELKVVVKQKPDQYRNCAEPSVLDPYGNIIASLSPKKEGTSNGEQETAYQYAFFAPTTGEYRVELDNHECSVALNSANAIVSWAVHPQ